MASGDSRVLRLKIRLRAATFLMTASRGDLLDDGFAAFVCPIRESRESLASASAAVSTEQSANPPAKDLSELGNIFSLLDGLRGLLAETLDGWQPPQLVVVGQESSGKSSVLERTHLN